jgi:transposase
MNNIIFLGLDVHKEKIAVAVAEGGRGGEVRQLGNFLYRPDHIKKLVERLAKGNRTLSFCYEAGPFGYVLYRQLIALGHECMVAAPSLIPMKAGDRVKTDRRDAVMLAKFHRAGELTAVWVASMKFQRGNIFSKGRVRGSKNKRTQLADHFQRGEEHKLARAIIEDALADDANARKLIADRLWPARVAPPTPIALPRIADVSDLTLASGALVGSVARRDCRRRGRACCGVARLSRQARRTCRDGGTPRRIGGTA